MIVGGSYNITFLYLKITLKEIWTSKYTNSVFSSLIRFVICIFQNVGALIIFYFLVFICLLYFSHVFKRMYEYDDKEEKKIYNSKYLIEHIYPPQIKPTRVGLVVLEGASAPIRSRIRFALVTRGFTWAASRLPDHFA